MLIKMISQMTHFLHSLSIILNMKEAHQLRIPILMLATIKVVAKEAGTEEAATGEEREILVFNNKITVDRISHQTQIMNFLQMTKTKVL